MSKTNFLIGRGELLTYDIKGPKRGGEKSEAYLFVEAKRRLKPQFIKTAAELDTLPNDACPRDFGVARLTLNPSYIAKSYFPIAMLRSVGLESVGSRTVRLTPEKWTKKGVPSECSTTELFVAGKRNVFRHLDQWMDEVEPESDEALNLAHIENFSGYGIEERVRFHGAKKEHFFEVGVHLLPDEDSSFIQAGFVRYAEQLDFTVHLDLGFRAGNLWFVPVEGVPVNVDKLATFVFVRVIRPVPKLRGMRPVKRASTVSISCNLPTEQPWSSEPKVAILACQNNTRLCLGCVHIDYLIPMHRMIPAHWSMGWP